MVNVSKILQMVEKGRTANFKNESLEEIDFGENADFVSDENLENVDEAGEMQ